MISSYRGYRFGDRSKVIKTDRKKIIFENQTLPNTNNQKKFNLLWEHNASEARRTYRVKFFFFNFIEFITLFVRRAYYYGLINVFLKSIIPFGCDQGIGNLFSEKAIDRRIHVVLSKAIERKKTSPDEF